MKTAVFRVLTACILISLALPIFAQQDTPDLTPMDLSSPGATIRTFFDSMSAVKQGNEDRLPQAIACLYLEEAGSESEQLDKGTKAAYILFDYLDTLQFSTADIPKEVSGRDYTVTLGKGEDAIELRLHRYDDDQWRLNTASLSEERLNLLKEKLKTKEAEGEEAQAGDHFIPNMRSPRATMQTFIRGMNETDGLTREHAIATLDLSGVSETQRQEVGNELAIQLKHAMDRIANVEYSAIPQESDGIPYAFYQGAEGEGSIVIDVLVVDEESQQKAWKFTSATVDSIETLYNAYRDKELAEGVLTRTVDLPLAIRIRTWFADHFPILAERWIYLENWQWLGLLLVVFAGMVISRLLGFLILTLIQKRFNKAKFKMDLKLGQDFVRPIRIALMAWFWLLGLTLLGLPPDVRLYLKIAAKVVTAIGAVWALYRLIDIVGNYLSERAMRSENKFDDLLVPILIRSLKVFAIVFAVVIIAEQSDADISALLTGLGLGGLAFALAAKDMVANIFGCFTILMDKPFQIGDWVTIGSIDGNVESVGVRSTRIRTFYNSLITVPNSELINQSVDNMGERTYRRIKTTIAITYDTPPEKIEAFCEGIRELIRQHPYTRKDYFHCYLNQFSAASLDILLYCFVKTPDWSTELRERERLFLDIIRLAQKLNVDFAFPTQTLYMRQENNPTHAAMDSVAQAQRDGRRGAMDIMQQTIGLNTMPPPVSFDEPSHGEDSEGE